MICKTSINDPLEINECKLLRQRNNLKPCAIICLKKIKCVFSMFCLYRMKKYTKIHSFACNSIYYQHRVLEYINC